MDIRGKLIEILKQAPFEGKVLDEWWWEEKIKRIADHLISNGVTVQEWISVEKRLPEPGERVLATDGGFIGEFYVNRLGQWQRYNVNDHSLLMALDILWWMPMPQPPKGE